MELSSSRFAGWLIWAAGCFRRMRDRHPDIPVTLATLLGYGVQRPTRVPALALRDPENILVVQLGAMGDLILSTLIFRELKLRYPDSRITALVQELHKDVLEGNPYVHEVLCVEIRTSNWLFRRSRTELALTRIYLSHLRNRRFDLVLNPRLQYDYYGGRYLTRLVAGNVTVEYATRNSEGKTPAEVSSHRFTKITVLPRPKPQLEVLSNMNFIEYVTGRPCTSLPRLYPGEEDRAFARRVSLPAEPGAFNLAVSFEAGAESRRWPLERSAEVVNKLAESVSISAFVICPKSKEAEGRELMSMLRTKATLVSGATLRQLTALLDLCDLSLGPDSGLAHMSAASNCAPIVVSPHPLDGDIDHRNSPALFAPFSPSAQIVRPAQALPPCRGACDAVKPHCILQVTTDQVVSAAMNAIRQLDSESVSGQLQARCRTCELG
jgi:heptosyltransferase-2